MKKVFTWVNSDLDGIGSVVLLNNLFKNHEYRAVFFGDFERQFSEWWEINEHNYSKVFIVGIPLDQSMVNKLDHYNIIFVSDNDSANVYDSTLIHEDTTSCTKLLYKKFKSKNFSNELKKFFTYINDYNAYSLNFEESKYINALYRKSGSNKFDKLVRRFQNGFDGFTSKEINLAESFFSELEKELEGLDLYRGEYKKYKVISTLSNFSVNEISASILENYDTDFVMIVNPKSQFVSIRKKEGVEGSAKMIAETLCDGGGNDSSAGGKITQKFLDFTTKLHEA